MSSLAVMSVGAAQAIVSVGLSPLFYVAMVFYAGAAAFGLGVFFRASPKISSVAYWALIFGFVAHGGEIGWRGVEDVHPGTSVREALGFLSWLLVGGFLLASLRHRLHVLRTIVASIALVILAIARLSPSGEMTSGLNALGRIHISLATFGVALFALATAVGVMYIAGERSLKGKHFDGLMFRRGIALESLDVLAHRIILVAFPVFTTALMLGAIWVSQRKSTFDRPEYPLALVTWLSFASILIARTTHGWRGRRAAWLTIFGFAAALMVFAIYLLRRILG